MTRSSGNIVPLRSRDADRTQQAVLRAAMWEFAEAGLGGARIDRIAERAGINKKLTYYYFTSKDELFLAVLEQTFAEIREAERELHLDAAPPVDALRRLLAFTWEHYLAHPEFLTLLNSENRTLWQVWRITKGGFGRDRLDTNGGRSRSSASRVQLGSNGRCRRCSGHPTYWAAKGRFRSRLPFDLET